jgi:hypothetical protein
LTRPLPSVASFPVMTLKAKALKLSVLESLSITLVRLNVIGNTGDNWYGIGVASLWIPHTKGILAQVLLTTRPPCLFPIPLAPGLAPCVLISVGLLLSCSMYGTGTKVRTTGSTWLTCC